MEIEIRTTEEDYRGFYKYFYFQRNLKRRILWTVLASLIIAISHDDSQPFLFSLWIIFLKFLLAGAILFGLVFPLPYLFAIRRLSKSVLSEKSPLKRKKIILTENGIDVETADDKIFWGWDSIKSVDSNKMLIAIFLFDNTVYLIPRRLFSSEYEAKHFRESIQREVLKIRIQVKREDVGRLYYWGFLGLIPLVGGITGIILLFRGIFQYKDAKLVLIGTGCILLTVGVYSYMFYDSEYGKSTGKSFEHVAQMELNNCMKDVEFFKMQHGVYPNSLEQIKANNQLLTIDDPLQTRKFGNKITKFNYHRVGGNYYLFSSGLDGIPNTSDDLYPALIDSDNNKFGLIRHR